MNLTVYVYRPRPDHPGEIWTWHAEGSQPEPCPHILAQRIMALVLEGEDHPPGETRPYEITRFYPMP